MSKPELLEDLTFLRDGEYWKVRPSGNWTSDTATGRDYAKALCAYMRSSGEHFLLGHITRAIGLSGSWSGIEVGFFQEIAEQAA